MAALNNASGDASPAWVLRATFSAAESPAAAMAASAASTASATADSVMAVGFDTRYESIGGCFRARQLLAPSEYGGACN